MATKIGIVCPVGPLDRYGYQYSYMAIAESLSAFATRVYLCSSARNRANTDELLSRLPNIQYVSNEDTWLDTDPSDNEVFRIAQLEKNVNLTVERCKRDGMDCAIQVHINQYVQDSAREQLRQSCTDMLEAGRPFEWLYRKHQLGNRLFHADVRVPWILNLQIDNPFLIRADSIHHRNGCERYRIENGSFRSKDCVAIVDCPLEMTWQDLEAKLNFLRCYSELNPQANPKFEHHHYLRYYTHKFASKSMSDEPLDATGRAIARNSRDSFVCWTIVRNYRWHHWGDRILRCLARFWHRLE